MVDLLRERMADEHQLDSEEHNDIVEEADHAYVPASRSQRGSETEDASVDAMAARIVTGEPYSERKSTFQVSFLTTQLSRCTALPVSSF